MITPVSNTNLIVKNTPNNHIKPQPAPVVFMADVELIGDYLPVARKTQPLRQDVFESSAKVQQNGRAQISFMKRVAKFFGLN